MHAGPAGPPLRPFLPGSAAHKPSCEVINKLQSVGSPHVTTYQRVFHTKDRTFHVRRGWTLHVRHPDTRGRNDPRNAGKPGKTRRSAQAPSGAAPGPACFCVRGSLPWPRPARAGSGILQLTSHLSRISPMRSGSLLDFSPSISYYLQRFRKKPIFHMLIRNDFGKKKREHPEKSSKIKWFSCTSLYTKIVHLPHEMGHFFGMFPLKIVVNRLDFNRLDLPKMPLLIINGLSALCPSDTL